MVINSLASTWFLDKVVAFTQISFFSLLNSDRFLPDKAIDFIDEDGSLVRLRHAQVHSCMFLTLRCSFFFFFCKLATVQRLHRRVIGLNKIVIAIILAILRPCVGLENPNRQIQCYEFLKSILCTLSFV